MSERTKKLLIELYALDPSLRDHEPALLSVLERISAAKPDVQVDQAFLAELRNTLLAAPATANARPPSLIHNLFSTMSKTPFILGGLGATAVLVAVIMTLPGQTPNGSPMPSRQVAMADIVDAQPGAFGDLTGFARDAASSVKETAPTPAPAVPMAATEPSTLGTSKAVSALPPHAGGGVGSAADSRMMIAPWSQQTYALSYDKEGNAPIDITVQPVYRRSMDTQAMSQFAESISGHSNGILDFAKLQDLRVERIALFEDRADGYSMELNLFDGSMYLGLDWRHQQPYDPALDQPLRPSEMPTDEALIAASDAFMDRFGIDRTVYGKPSVEKTWQRYTFMADKDSAVAPSMVTVLYPQLVEGTQVAEFGGEVAGLRVSVRARDLKVTNLGGLTTRRFERSTYAFETDTARLIAFAEKGGLRGQIYQSVAYDDQGNPIGKKGAPESLRLGAPKQILVKMYHADGNVSTELYVPALQFPILNVPTDQNYYGPQDVVVPLVKDLLDEQERAMSQPPEVMPYGQPTPVMMK